MDMLRRFSRIASLDPMLCRSGTAPFSREESGMIGTTEIIVIVVVILVLFGASAIPKFARSLGEAKKEFTKAMKDSETSQVESSGKDDGKKDSKS
jgi:sec-independent protein translocase protein TatA